jgi:ATP synthase protein I
MDEFTRKILLIAALPTTGVGLAVTAIVWLTMGASAGIGALVGVAVVVPFFAIGQLILAKVLKHNPAMGMTVAMMLYLGKIAGLAVLLVLLADTSAFDTKIFAVNVLVCTLVWTAAEVWILANSKVLYVDPDNVPEELKVHQKLTAPRD